MFKENFKLFYKNETKNILTESVAFLNWLNLEFFLKWKTNTNLIRITFIKDNDILKDVFFKKGNARS